MVTTWKSSLPAFEHKLDRTVHEIHSGVVQAAEESIVRGSVLTGSPGQPEDLRNGEWVVVPEGELKTVIGTDDHSALSVEDGISHLHGGPITLNTAVGGFHSVALTHQSGDRIIQRVASRYVQK